MIARTRRTPWHLLALGPVVAIGMAGPAAVARAQSPSDRPPVPEAPAGVTAFVGVAVVPMDRERVLVGQTVLVKNGRIAALGPADRVRVPAGAVRIDGRGKFLIPGLADMHAHISSFFSNDDRITYDSAAAERRLFLWLANGITTVRNLDYYEIGDFKSARLDSKFVLRLRARVAAGELLSPRIYTSGPWGQWRDTRAGLDREQPRLDSVAAYVTAYKAAGYDFLKVHDESPEIIEALGVATRRVGMPLIGHVPKGRTPAWAFATGYRSIEHFTGYPDPIMLEAPPAGTAKSDVRGPTPTRRDTTAWEPLIQALAAATRRAGVWNCPTVLLEEGQRRHEVFLRRRLVKALQDAGAGLLLGTDAVGPFNGSKQYGDPGVIHRELEALVRAGLTPYQALATGTRNVAEFFNMPDESGTVAVGKRADLLLLNGNPLEQIRNTAQPAGVMIGGRWLPREELDRRVAVAIRPPGPRQALYWTAIEEAGVEPWSRATVLDGLTLSAGQRTAFPQLAEAQNVQRRALLDSLGAGADSAATQRVIRLLARHLGEWRALLAPEQQDSFDLRARTWQKRREAEGYSAEIAGVSKR
jgi:imidazolonepropionase-like amidohydrolase